MLVVSKTGNGIINRGPGRLYNNSVNIYDNNRLTFIGGTDTNLVGYI